MLFDSHFLSVDNNNIREEEEKKKAGTATATDTQIWNAAFQHHAITEQALLCHTI